MTQVMASSVSDIEALAPSWRLSLESENKSSATLMSYGYATTQFVAFLQEKGEADGRHDGRPRRRSTATSLTPFTSGRRVGVAVARVEGSYDG